MKSTDTVEAGQKVTYKRNGFYGSYDAEVISSTYISGKLTKVTLEVTAWCGQPLVKKFIARVKPDRIR